MRRGLDVEKAEAAMKRAADTAIHGTREERAGRFVLRDNPRPLRDEPPSPSKPKTAQERDG